MRHAMHSYDLPLGTILGKLLGQHLLPADSQSGICISSWKEMLINIPSQRQVCYSSVRERVRERGKKKKRKRREKIGRPHRTSQYPKTNGAFVGGRRTDHSALGRTMQIDWKQGGILYSIFINNPRVSERLRQPLPQGYLANLMEPNKRTGDFHRASSFSQQSNCKSSTLSSKLSRGKFPFPSVLSSLSLPPPVPLPMLHPWNYASPQLWKFPSHYSKKQGFC